MPYVSNSRFCELRMANATKGLCTSRPPIYLDEELGYSSDGVMVCTPVEASEIINFMPEKKDGTFINYISRDGVSLINTSGGPIPDVVTDMKFVNVGATNRLVAICADNNMYYMNLTTNAFTLIGQVNNYGTLVPIGLLYGQTTGEPAMVVFDGKRPHIYRPNATGGERTFRICWDKSGYMVDNITGVSETSTISLYSGSTVRAGVRKTMSAWCTHSDTSIDGIPVLTGHIQLRKVGTPTGTIVMKVYDSTGATVLGQSYPILASSLATTAALYTFTFISPYFNMLPSVTYIFAIEYTAGDVSNYVVVSDTIMNTGEMTYTVAGGWSSANELTKGVIMDIQPGLAPTASQGLVHASRVIALNPNNQKGYIWYTNLLDPDDWTAPATGTNSLPDAGALPIGDVSGTIVNAVSVQSNLYLVNGLTSDKVYRLSGTGPADFSLTSVMEGIRGVNFKCGVSANGNGYVLDPKGLVCLTEIDQGKKLTESMHSSRISDQFDLTSVPFLTWIPSYSQIWMINTTDDTSFLVYDTETTQWVSFLYNGFTPTAVAQNSTTVVIAGSNLQLYQVMPNIDSDAGSALMLKYKSSFSDLGNPYERKIFDRFNLEVTAGFGASGTLYLYRDGIYDYDYYRDFGAVRSGKLTVGDLYGVPLASLKWPLGGSSSDTTFLYDHNYAGLANFGGLDMTQFNFTATGPSMIGSDFKLRYSARRVMAELVINSYAGKVRIKRMTLRGKQIGRRIQ